jgi:hypothetical protein
MGISLSLNRVLVFALVSSRPFPVLDTGTSLVSIDQIFSMTMMMNNVLRFAVRPCTRALVRTKEGAKTRGWMRPMSGQIYRMYLF